MEYFQNFNYHTHTKRCGHAGMYETEEYVLKAREAGIKSLGFSDHCPVPTLEFQDIKARMHLTEVDNYINEINNIKEKYRDIEILTGFECEYDNNKSLFLSELRDKVDYMVLGQHFIIDVQREGNSDYPTVYAHEVCAAMESGLFDIVAHPDIFMCYSGTFTQIEDQNKFMENAKVAFEMICKKAKELNIPLEINLHGIVENKGYPNKLFWETCERIGAPVIYGVDAHEPKEFLLMKENMEKAEEQIGYANLNILESYNPVMARKNNKALDLRLNETDRSGYTYEAMLAKKIIENIVNDDQLLKLDIDTLKYCIKEKLNSENTSFKNYCKEKNEKKTAESLSISRDDRFSYDEKMFYTSRIRESLIKSEETINNREKFIDDLIKYVDSAIQLGARTKDEIAYIVIQLSELNNTNNIEKKRLLMNSLDDFYRQRVEEGSMEKGSRLVKSNPLFGKFESDSSSFMWSSDGFTNVMAVAMILMFILGIGVGIAMMLLGL